MFCSDADDIRAAAAARAAREARPARRARAAKKHQQQFLLKQLIQRLGQEDGR